MSIRPLLLGLAALSLAACGGTTEKREVVRETTNVVHESKTAGQELIDLKAAYDQGLISYNEYSRKREVILQSGR